MICYVDTGVFVTPILKNRSDAVIDECLAWQEKMSCGQVTACTSWLTWDEVTYVAGRAGDGYDVGAAARAGELLLALPNLTFLDVDVEVISRAQTMLSAGAFRPRDCVHASTAVLHAGGLLVSLDSDFAGPVGKAHGVEAVTLGVRSGPAGSPAG